nr:nucleotide disphospho-sugar-binding domain-containing protein [Kibdelosporangium sp. MJ126-NF4]CEL17276.1 Glycosyltransferase [Kibdelosporangium sp. MJ126-NF4]CTQ91494.1 Glycosyltransferase [Kibdelosporangium sp. MJ126-NF4]
MRILFTVFGSRPHIYPLVPLAWAFRVAGHDVRLASTPMWAPDMAYTGLPSVSVGGSPAVTARVRDELANAMFTQQPWPADWAADISTLTTRQLAYLESVGRYLVAAAAAMTDELVAFARHWAPDMVVYDSFSYAGRVAAEVIGVPAIRHLSGTDSAQRLELTQPGPHPLPEYQALFDRFHVPQTIDAHATVDPTPPNMRVVTAQRLRPMRYIPYNGPGSTPQGLTRHRKRPRVCVTWGHTIASVGTTGTWPFRVAIDTIAALGMECLIAAPIAEVDKLGPLPKSVRALSAAPLHLVLPYCDAIVHQGGDGTLLTAATAAVPQLVIPASPEADMAGGRVAATGVGISVRYDTAATVADAVNRLLSDVAYREAAIKLRAEIESQPTPAMVAADLANG